MHLHPPHPVATLMLKKKNITVVFTALHGMQTLSSDEKSVRPSVSLSVRQMRE